MRYVLWLQGCPRQCFHCVTPEMQPIMDKTWIEVDELAGYIVSTGGIEGVTVVGGEPFLQCDALCRLVRKLQERGLTIMIYTGYTYEELLQSEEQEVHDILSLTDILVDGPYVYEEDHNEMWRGSANQRILFLSETYRSWEWVLGAKRDQAVHYSSNNGRYLIIGIPPKKPAG